MPIALKSYVVVVAFTIMTLFITMAFHRNNYDILFRINEWALRALTIEFCIAVGFFAAAVVYN